MLHLLLPLPRQLHHLTVCPDVRLACQDQRIVHVKEDCPDAHCCPHSTVLSINANVLRKLKLDV